MGLGVFGLKSIYNRKTQDIISNVKRQYIRSYSYGYVYGGDRGNPVGPAVSNLVRIDLDTTTYFTLSAGPTDLIRSTTGSYFSSSLKYGYIVGGLRPGGVPSPSVGRTNIDRIDFSTEVISSPGAGLVSSKQGGSTGQSSAYGYYGGGYSTGTGYICTIERLDFSTSVSALISAGFPSARVRASSHSSPTIFYAVGGQVGTTPITYLSSISRLTFSTDTLSLNPSPIPAPGGILQAGSVYTSDRGYIMGGSGTTSYCLIYRLDFSTGSVNPISNPLSTVTSNNHSGNLVGSRYGYLFGGTNSPLITATSTIHRLNLSGEEVSVVPSSYGYETRDGSTFTSTETISQTLSLNSYSFQNYSESASYGYFAGGSNNTGYPVGWQNTIDRLDLSNETTSAPGKNLLSRRAAAAVPSSVYGYFGAGGDNSAAAFVDSADKYVDRLDYSNESVSRISATLPTGGASSCGNIWSNNYGYFGGGFINLCALDRLDFSSETVQTKKVIIPRRDVYFNQNNLYGYFSGGSAAPSTFNQVERLDFSTETMQLPGNNLTASSTIGGNVSSNTYGYMARTTNTPQPNFTFTNKLDFSTETIESPSNIIFANTHAGGISGSFVGYLAGGMPPTFAFPANTSIRKINFSTDTNNILPSTLPQGRFELAAVSGGQSQRVLTGRTVATYGYFGGGDTGGIQVCTIDRLDFSTETVLSPGSYQLSQPKFRLAAVSNSSYGYYGAGFAPPGPSSSCTVDRLDFTTEVRSNPGVSITRARGALSANSNASYGYFMGGGPVSGCILDRIDFSNETSIITLNNITPRIGAGSVSNSSYGYFGGGLSGASSFSSIFRLDYYTETFGAAIGALLSIGKEYMGGASSASYGYFGGGGSPLSIGRVCSIDRVEFSTETTSLLANQLTTPRYGTSASASSSYGYFAGGNNPTPINVCTIDRLDFFTNTVSLLGSNLTAAKSDFAAVSNDQIASTATKGFAPFSATYGYFGGGYDALPNPVTKYSLVDRLDFSTEVIKSLGNILPDLKSRFATVSSFSYGYFANGSTNLPGVLCNIDRLDFSIDTFSSPGKNLSKGSVNLGGLSSSSYGYFAGGFQPPTTPIACSIDRIDFSNESTSVPGNQLTQARAYVSAVSSSSYGYFVGAYTPAVPNILTTIDRIDFSTETISLPGKNLTSSRFAYAAVSSTFYGYFGGGSSPTDRSLVERIDFSNETISTPGKNLTQERDNLAATSSSSYGYFAGGAAFVKSTIDRLDFSTEVCSLPPSKSVLSVARSQLSAVSSAYKPPIRNGWGWRKTYGYFGGGERTSSNFDCTINRLDFSTETTSTLLSSISETRSGLAAVSSSSYGWFGGGSQPVIRSTIDRLDFSTETTTIPASKLSSARTGLAAVSSSSYGYFGGGGSTVLCVIDRLDFSTETRATPGAYQLSQARYRLAAVSSSPYGYFAGGFEFPISTVYSTIDRLDFLIETISTPGNKLPEAKGFFSGNSSGSYGYFASGSTGPVVVNICTIDRLDFSTQTVNTLTNSIGRAKQNVASVSSGSYGYFAGGNNPNINANTDIIRLDFSTEIVLRSIYNLPNPKSSSGDVSDGN